MTENRGVTSWMTAILLVSLAFLVGTQVYAEPLAVSGDDARAIQEMFRPLFQGFNEKAGIDLLNSLADSFRPTESSGKLLALKLGELKETIGALEGYQPLGVQAVRGVDCYYRIGFISLHVRQPAIWEATVYKREGKWNILSLSFSTEDILDKAAQFSTPLPGR